ncbi:MAG: nucleoside triphosphate pyrophosphohydrolase [Acidobacteria bacterium]|nr:MAG: nucleoside triphosphate pyrophosphohydrolase [Acidobacteriota bacterium]
MESQQDHLDRLSKLVARLRGPDGCPWDREQTLADVRAYLLEEAHEVAGAIDEQDPVELKVELGDLLFQMVFAVSLAEEEQAFTFAEVVEGAESKMIARHPHVFGDEELADSGAVREAWERRKLDSGDPDTSLLAGVPASLPALLAAYRIGQKTAGVGFDWPGPVEVLAKLEEELEELRQELAAEEDSSDAVTDELGDLLFTLANLARHLGVDPEAALARANQKFRRRFAAMEGAFRDQGRSIGEATLEALEAAWQQAKRLVG